MFNRKRLCIFLSVFMCLLHAPVVSAAPSIRVFLNGNEIFYDVPAQVIASHTMAPLSQTIQAITGSPAEWNSATRTVTFRVNGHTNVHKIGEKIVYMDGKPIYFDSPSLILDNRTLVPIRMIAETSGCQVDWDGANRFVMITGKPSANNVKILSAVPSQTTVTEGSAISMTIKTNSDAQYVWVNYSNPSVSATLVSTDAAGVKTWSASPLYPLQTGQITVYANKENIVATATKLSVGINVTPRNNTPSIYSISPGNPSIYNGDALTLTITTNEVVNNVWLDYNNTSMNATYQSAASSGNKTWRATLYPNETQSLRIYANTSKTSLGAASDSVRVSVSIYNPTPTPTPTAAPVINSSSCWIDSNFRVHLEITTNTVVEQVDIAGNYFGSDTLYQSSTSGNTKTWTCWFDVPDGFYGSSNTFDIAAYGNNKTAKDKTTVFFDSGPYLDGSN